MFRSLRIFSTQEYINYGCKVNFENIKGIFFFISYTVLRIVSIIFAKILVDNFVRI